MNAKLEPQSTQQALTITRIFNAPRNLVFDAWSTPNHLKHWCYPHNFTVPFSEMDFRPGSAYRTCLRAPNGQDHWVQGIYREIVAPKRLVFTHAWEDDEGRPTLETLVTVTFEDLEDRAQLTFHQAAFDSAESRNSHRAGWTETLDNLETYLAIARDGGVQ